MNANYEATRDCNKELARCYVPMQVMNEVFDGREGLRKGTIFPELYRPYTPGRRRERGERYYG